MDIVDIVETVVNMLMIIAMNILMIVAVNILMLGRCV